MTNSSIAVKIPEQIDNIPIGKRLNINTYGISSKNEGILKWDEINDWILKSNNYWITTTKRNGDPHARPIWGIWMDNIFYFGGGKTQNTKNLENKNKLIVHSESGQNVFIIEGIVYEIPPDLQDKLDDKYEEKYEIRHGPKIWWVKMKRMLAWKLDDFANTPTYWKF